MSEWDKPVADAWQHMNSPAGPYFSQEGYANADLARSQLLAANRGRAQIKAMMEENQVLRDQARELSGLLEEASETIEKLVEENKKLKARKK